MSRKLAALVLPVVIVAVPLDGVARPDDTSCSAAPAESPISGCLARGAPGDDLGAGRRDA